MKIELFQNITPEFSLTKTFFKELQPIKVENAKQAIGIF